MSAELAEAVQRMRRALARWTGLDCGRGGREGELERLLRTRTAEIGLGSPEEYLAQLDLGLAGGTELQRVINAITVGYTWFFRDSEMLQLVTTHLAASAASRAPGTAPSLWVAGCASGDEAYSLAMLAAASGQRIAITASDINTQLLLAAREAEYGDWSLRLVPLDLARFLEPARPGHRRVTRAVRELVRFQQHNLVDPPLAVPSSVGAGWDIIVCRNVLVYFDAQAMRATIRSFLGALSDGGLLVLGSGEALAHLAELAEPVPLGTRTAYRRRTQPRPVWAKPARPVAPVPPAPAVATPVATSAATPVATPIATMIRDEPRPTPVPPSRLEDLLARGASLLDSGDVAGALARFVAGVEADPLCAEARLLIGIAHHAAGDLEAAHAPLRSALFLAPDLWLASFYLARVHEELGRAHEARREYRRVISQAGRAEPGGSQFQAILAGWTEAARNYAAHALTRLS